LKVRATRTDSSHTHPESGDLTLAFWLAATVVGTFRGSIPRVALDRVRHSQRETFHAVHQRDATSGEGAED
jgi:hypothetical protein